MHCKTIRREQLEEELRQDENDRIIHKLFIGELKPPNKLILKRLKEEYKQ